MDRSSTARIAGKGLAILTAGWLASAGFPALADGPGFSVSGYQVEASAHAGGLGTAQSSTVQNASVSTSVTYSPFDGAEGDAHGLFGHANVLACCGGPGEAGAGGGGKIYYTIEGGTAGTVYPLTFHFAGSGAFGTIGTAGGIAYASLLFDETIGSDLGSISNLPLVGIEATSTTPIHGTSATGFTFSEFEKHPNSVGFIGAFGGEIDASQFLVVSDDVTLDEEALGAELHGTAEVAFLGVTVPQNFVGALPTLMTQGGEPPIQVTRASVPEPGSWSLMILALFGLGRVLRSRWFAYVRAARNQNQGGQKDSA